MAVHHQSSPAPALLPLLPELPLQQQGVAAVLAVARAIAVAPEPVVLAQRLVHAFEKLLPSDVGLSVCVREAERDRLLAVGRLSPALAERLAETQLAVVSQPICLGLEAATLETPTYEQLQAAGVQGLLLLPLTVAGERIGQGLALLPMMYRLSSTVSQTLAAVAETAALALKVAMERQELAAQLVAEQDSRSSAEALVHALQQQMRQRRGRDAVTGLTSGRHFHSLLEIEVERARRYRDQLSLLLIDLDQFRHFNEAHGRVEGDKVLRRFGEILRQELRKVDHAFRYGGEEFTVILPRCNQRALLSLAERLRERFASEVFQVDGQAVQLSISIGASAYRQGTPVESFIRSVDDALYRAKATGRNRVVLA